MVFSQKNVKGIPIDPMKQGVCQQEKMIHFALSFRFSFTCHVIFQFIVGQGRLFFRSFFSRACRVLRDFAKRKNLLPRMSTALVLQIKGSEKYIALEIYCNIFILYLFLEKKILQYIFLPIFPEILQYIAIYRRNTEIYCNIFILYLFLEKKILQYIFLADFSRNNIAIYISERLVRPLIIMLSQSAMQSSKKAVKASKLVPSARASSRPRVLQRSIFCQRPILSRRNK